MKAAVTVGILLTAVISFAAGYTVANSNDQKEVSSASPIIGYSDPLSVPIESMEEVKTMAEDGNANAIAMLYNHYMYTANDRTEAERWILLGAEKDIVDYQLDAAEIALHQGNRAHAKKWLLEFESNPTSVTSMQMDKFYKMRNHLSKAN